jgi:DNA (cytosine-5)-methyltransferase 1
VGAPTVLSLFSGIGGFDLGFRAAGMQIVAQSEIDPFCCRVLAHHFPDVPNLGDVRTIDREAIGKLPQIDVICAGFP